MASNGTNNRYHRFLLLVVVGCFVFRVMDIGQHELRFFGEYQRSIHDKHNPIMVAPLEVPQSILETGATFKQNQKNHTMGNPQSPIQRIAPSIIIETNDTSHHSRNNNLETIALGDSFGYFEKTGRLVVLSNHTHLFWQKGQLRLCRLLRQMTNTKVLGEAWPRRSPTPLLRMTTDCVERSNDIAFGQGNWISAFYQVRLAAATAKVDFRFECEAGADPKMHLLTWLQGYYVAPTKDNPWPYSGTIPTAKDACTSKYDKLRIDKMTIQIQRDMRAMAHKVVGGDDYTFPTTKLDDVAIHFRCGDVLGGQFRNDFGMIPFREYKKWIFANTTSIGIVTQPFEKDRNRRIDGNRADECKVVVHKLVEYLQKAYPKARLRIHNDPDKETLSLAYTRLVLARQAFTSLTSFGIFPVVGTLGEGYFQKGNFGVNPWATHVPNYLFNIHQMNAAVLGTLEIYNMLKEKGLDAVVKWFTAEEDTDEQGKF